MEYFGPNYWQNSVYWGYFTAISFIFILFSTTPVTNRHDYQGISLFPINFLAM